ncbi:hypothetical protein [Kitasatospora sp. GAS1066B]|uniref:hypothetical protein n=1 Tax=Kitasatospora sp. GAS1066B TaxID=3156271 RepID=UPI0035176293
MKANRLAAATALALATLALTACGPDDTTSTGSAASAAPSKAATAPGTPTASSAPAATARPSGAKPTTAKPSGAKPSGAASTGATPTADCTANASGVGRVIEATDDGYLTHIWMKAKSTKFVCGPDIPDDGYFTSYGDPAVFTFSNDVKTTLLANAQNQPVDLDTFMKHVDDCLHNKAAVKQPYDTCRNQYAVTVNSQNVITKADELYHP